MGFFRKWNFFTPKNKNPRQQQIQPKVTVVLRYTVHCKNCINQIKKCVQRLKGVESAEVDEENPELITVKGVFEVQKLVAHVRRGVDKIVTVIKEENAAGGGSGGGEEGIEAAAAGGGSEQKIEIAAAGDGREQKIEIAAAGGGKEQKIEVAAAGGGKEQQIEVVGGADEIEEVETYFDAL